MTRAETIDELKFLLFKAQDLLTYELPYTVTDTSSFNNEEALQEYRNIDKLNGARDYLGMSIQSLCAYRLPIVKE